MAKPTIIFDTFGRNKTDTTALITAANNTFASYVVGDESKDIGEVILEADLADKAAKQTLQALRQTFPPLRMMYEVFLTLGDLDPAKIPHSISLEIRQYQANLNEAKCLCGKANQLTRSVNLIIELNI